MIDSYGKRVIIPDNILIKYSNEKKNNFDVYLDENGIFEFDKRNFTLYYNHPDIIDNYIENHDAFSIKHNLIKNKNELFILECFYMNYILMNFLFI